ncbi:Indole-3-glycerol phosphate synthase [compost metagenome]
MFMLDEILANKVKEVEEKKKQRSLEKVKEKAVHARAPRDFESALKQYGISLIAEVKRKSPSKGELRADFDALALARIYTLHGARAISVLADEKFFGGGAHVVEWIANDEKVLLPVMYKDFIIDKYQVYEARSVGADAVLIIVRAVEPKLLQEMIATVHDLGMSALVECFTAEEAILAVESGARIVGVNNRDLQTFEVDFRRSEEIRAVLPAQIVTVSESGISSRADALKAEEIGFEAMLVGEALLKAQDLVSRVREFAGLLLTQEKR